MIVHDPTAAAATWQRFVTACTADEQLGPYMGTVLALAASVLGDAQQNIATLDRIAAHLERAKEAP